jgi:DNA-3-methyladenine glycosylase II
MSPEAVAHLSAVDKTLARVIQRVGPCTLKPKMRRSPFEALVTAVTHQQLNGTAAMTILKRVLALYPGRRFPTPADLVRTPPERLRGAGLSQAKTRSILDIAHQTMAGVVPSSAAIRKMSEAEILERLTTVRGVGPWTVEMLLIFTLGRTDVLPASDYGVRKGFALAYRWKELPTPGELSEYGQRWSPHRSTAAWYMWRVLDLKS